MAVSIAVVVRARFNLKGQSSIKMEQIIRLLSFVVGYWSVFAYLIAFRGYVEETRTTPSQHHTTHTKTLHGWHGPCVIGDPLTDAIQEQIECSALSGGECELTYNINYGVWFIELVALGSHGIIVFMCLTFSKVSSSIPLSVPFWNKKKNVLTHFTTLGQLSILDGHDCKLERPVAHYHWCNFLPEHNNWITHLQQQQECTVGHQK